MKKSIIYLFCIFLISIPISSKEDNTNGLLAIIDDNIIMDSDFYKKNYSYLNNEIKKKNVCNKINEIITNALFLNYTNNDLLINKDINYELIEVETNLAVENILKKKNKNFLVKKYGVNYIYNLYNIIKENIKKNIFIENFFLKISKNIDVSPLEVIKYYNNNKSFIKKQKIKIYSLTLYPKINEKYRKKIINKLKKIKKEINNGLITFAAKAISISEDFSTAINGGLVKNLKFDNINKYFYKYIFPLKEGDISDPFQIENGFYLIKLEKYHDNNEIDIRCIFIKYRYNENEIYEFNKLANFIKKMIINKKIKFNKAVEKYSENYSNKYIGGVNLDPITGMNLIDEKRLSKNLIFQINKIKNDDNILIINEGIFNNENHNNNILNIIKYKKINPHNISIKKDYNQLLIDTKKEKIYNNLKLWVKNNLKNIFIKINNKYKECLY